MSMCLLALLAMLAEAALGYPDRLFRAAGHPVSWMGRLIDLLDRRLNLPAQADTGQDSGGYLVQRAQCFLAH
jgi:adenosylcobinamide-phosphate synthase